MTSLDDIMRGQHTVQECHGQIDRYPEYRRLEPRKQNGLPFLR